MTVTCDADAYGTHALPEMLERLRRFAQGLGRGPVARRLCSVVRRIVTLGRTGPIDVEVFQGQRARLYPRENLTDKRVLAARQFWDWAERDAIAAQLASRDGPVVMVDAGANAGLYTLAARSVAPGALRVLAIEPDPLNVRRLRFNLAASGAADEVVVAEVALGDQEGQVHLEATHQNRGELKVAETGTPVAMRPLLAVVRWAALDRIDVLKIDIEGLEALVLSRFLADAPSTLWPHMIILEARRGQETPALGLLRSNGYGIRARSRMNAILVRSEDPAGAEMG